MIVELAIDPLHGWCSWYAEGIKRYPDIYANLCRIHDIMDDLSKDGVTGVRLYGQIYTWNNMGFESPLIQEEQDAWLMTGMLDVAEHLMDLTDDEREEIRKDACNVYLGLRSVGRIYRAI